MDKLKAYFRTRNFSADLLAQDVQLKVNNLEWNAIGGPVIANLSAAGMSQDIWEFLEYLRRPVEIQNERGEAIWWGYVAEARIRVDAIEIGVSLDSMCNSVAVVYSLVEVGMQTSGIRKTTAWGTDADSIAEYGQKDLISSQNDLSDAAATGRRDAILAALKWPQSVAGQFASSKIGANSDRQANGEVSLVCRGWFDTLRWRMASVSGTTSVVTTTQIANLITTYGAFLTGTEIEAASGISSNEYRDGDTSVQDEILGLLASGGASGRRLLCAVDINRRLRVWEEPANTTVNYLLNSQGVLLNSLNVEIEQTHPPVGVWARLVDVIPGSTDVSKLSSPELQFIEGASWDKDQGLKLLFRGQPSVEDMFKVGKA